MKLAREMEVTIKKQGVTRWWHKNIHRTDNLKVTELIGDKELYRSKYINNRKSM